MVFSSTEITFSIYKSMYDLLHIIFYMSIFFIALLIALGVNHKTIIRYYKYLPLLINKTLTNPYTLRSRLFFKNTIWTPISNRSPYITKTIKNIKNKIFK